MFSTAVENISDKFVYVLTDRVRAEMVIYEIFVET